MHSEHPSAAVPTDLRDPARREAATRRLAEQYIGRPVLLGPGVLAGQTRLVETFLDLGCRVLVLATADGAGSLPDPDRCTVVRVELPTTASMTEEIRVLDRTLRTLPAGIVAAVEDFDPGRRGVWHTPPFVDADEPVLGRPVTGGRPASYATLEDKLRADALWAGAGVDHAPYRICAVDRAELAAASADLAGPQGVVWSGDARDGVNGGGNFVRWVRDPDHAAAAFAFFAPRCDRVRVTGFLDGVPCSIHGVVLPDGAAVFRPVELAILRDPAAGRFVYGGLSTWWDPPPADREAMRAVARRVGDHLAAHHSYRGAFGIDGVLTSEGFRPTELNARMSAGFGTIGAVDRPFFTLLNAALVAGADPALRVEDLESLVVTMDAERHGRPSAVGQGVSLGAEVSYPVTFDGARLTRASASGPAGASLLVAGDTASGFFAKIEPCRLLAPGDRLAPLNVALLAHLDAVHGTSFGALEAAPERREGSQPAGGATSVS